MLDARSMQAVRIAASGRAELVRVAVPAPAAGFCRVRVHAAAICRTDFDVISGTIGACSNTVPGHEWSGVVEATGAPADKAWIGRRVVGDNEITCLRCPFCRSGQWRRCPSYRQIGFQEQGAYAEFLCVPVANLHGLPDKVSFEQGALLEPMAVGLAVAAKAEAGPGKAAVVLGAGPIGLNCVAALRLRGASPIFVLDRRPERLPLAGTLGADEVADSVPGLRVALSRRCENEPGIVIEATGSGEMLRLGLETVAFGGALVLAGYFGGETISLKPDLVHERNVRVLGAGNNCGFLEEAIHAVEHGRVSTEAMITHRHALEEYEAALDFKRTLAPDYVKGVFLPVRSGREG